MTKRQRQWITAGVVLLIVVILYISGVFYFCNHFFPGVSAGPVNVGQHTVTDAQEEVNRQMNEFQLLFTEGESEIGQMSSSELAISVPIQEELQAKMESQNPYAWPLHILGSEEPIDISQQLQLDQEQVTHLIPSLGVNNSERQPTVDAQIIMNGDNTHAIQDEVLGNQIDAHSMEVALRENLLKGEEVMTLEQAYVRPSFTKDNVAMQAKTQYLEDILSTQITLEFDGHQITIPRETIYSWITINENNEPVINEELISEYILELNRQYSGLFLSRSFESTYQGTVSVPSGTYGWYMDRFEEAEVIAEKLRNTESGTYAPVIEGDGYGAGESVGNSYVEVDLTYQMMFIYIDGELMLETPIVSGNVGTDTVAGTYQVWNMEVDSTLVGYNPVTEKDYEQPVDYWIAFDNQAQGIHDANWQPYFGGDAYINNGSLGCINTPPWIMPQVFELVYYGMPVLVFW